MKESVKKLQDELKEAKKPPKIKVAKIDKKETIKDVEKILKAKTE